MAATPAWLAAVEALLNRGIHASAQTTTLARRLEGTALRVNIEGWTAFRASIAGGRLAIIAAEESLERSAAGHSDATISGSPLALLHLARGRSNRDVAGAAAQVRGDAEVATLYRQLFFLARPDLEEELSRTVGDLPARRLSQIAKHSAAWIRKARRVARENVAEYLQEESRDLVSKAELEEFLRGVDGLRETADRVAARISRLEQRPKGAA